MQVHKLTPDAPWLHLVRRYRATAAVLTWLAVAAAVWLVGAVLVTVVPPTWQASYLLRGLGYLLTLAARLGGWLLLGLLPLAVGRDWLAPLRRAPRLGG